MKPWQKGAIVVVLFLACGCVDNGPPMTALSEDGAVDTQTPNNQPEEFSSASDSNIRSSIGPLPEEFFAEIFHQGYSENRYPETYHSSVRIWVKNEKRKTEWNTTEGDGSAFLYTNLYIPPDYYSIQTLGIIDIRKECSKSTPSSKVEPVQLFDYYEIAYNPFLENTENAIEYWDSKCSEDPICVGINATEVAYNGEAAFLVTIQGKWMERTVKFWLEKETGFPIKREIYYNFGNSTTEYLRIEEKEIPDYVFEIPEECLN